MATQNSSSQRRKWAVNAQRLIGDGLTLCVVLSEHSVSCFGIFLTFIPINVSYTVRDHDKALSLFAPVAVTPKKLEKKTL